jgi:hypothetical protein
MVITTASRQITAPRVRSARRNPVAWREDLRPRAAFAGAIDLGECTDNKYRVDAYRLCLVLLTSLVTATRGVELERVGGLISPLATTDLPALTLETTLLLAS